MSALHGLEVRTQQSKIIWKSNIHISEVLDPYLESPKIVQKSKITNQNSSKVQNIEKVDSIEMIWHDLTKNFIPFILKNIFQKNKPNGPLIFFLCLLLWS